MRILVTGGAGFIGSHFVEYYTGKGHEVVVFDNYATGHNKYKSPLVKYIEGDITKTEDLNKIDGKFDYVVHLAAAISVAESMTNPEKYRLNNT